MRYYSVVVDAAPASVPSGDAPQLSDADALAAVKAYAAAGDDVAIARHAGKDQLQYCPECYLPLHPDPRPERLYIFLHALRYTTSLGSFETAMPAWAERGFKWEWE